MKASVVIPARNAEATLPAALRSIDAASAGLDVDVVVIDDAEGRGPSWARNRGLDKATGDVVFFVDADDTVEKNFFRRPLEVLERTGADLCFFTYSGGPALDERVIEGVDAVRARFLPAFFGYSMDDVRRWNAGGALAGRKELGQVWRCAFRKSFLDRHAIRFDEAMTFYEDAAFLSCCTAFAARVATVPDELYVYNPLPGGNLARGSGSRRHWAYKFLVLDARKRLDAATDGAVWPYCAASCVFSAMEMLRLWKKAGLSLREARADLRRYLSDAKVREAVKEFPLSIRHPLAAAAVLGLRVLIR